MFRLRSPRKEQGNPSSYVPPPKVLNSVMKTSDGPAGQKTVTLPAELFWRIFEAAASLQFDEQAYLERYTDVREAVAAGKLPSGLKHYVANGYREGRIGLSYYVDEPWYLQTYPDVEDAIRRGAAKSASEHFLSHGYFEGRCPNEQFYFLVKQWGDTARAAQARSASEAPKSSA